MANQERERILIIGNGFDLAHFLPTKYEHFIHVMRAIEEADNDSVLSFKELYKQLLGENDYILVKCEEIYKTEDFNIQVNELKNDLVSNGWFQFFKKQIDSGIDTWIDFENEIEYALESVCNLMNEMEEDANYFMITVDGKESFIKRDLLRVKMFRKYPALHTMLWQFEIIDRSQNDRERILLNKSFVKYYHKRAVYLDINNIFSTLTSDWNDFIKIFTKYISYIEKIEPRKEMKKPKVLKRYITKIYSFNYSSTINRFYVGNKIDYLHGNIENNNIVLGISDIKDDLLIKEKAYAFAKYYQKLVNKTDYQFLSRSNELKRIENMDDENFRLGKVEPYEIYIWGHSLDSSDSDYIREMFSFNKGLNPSVYIIVYYFGTPHAQLANLISIMGKDIIEQWMKAGWLEFVETPDIYRLNTEEEYEDKLSDFYEKQSKPLNL